ncbi:hypothetical protein Hypma_011448 [Hypsizygus marmoreus]|uniref:Zinc-ribbon 15 domain-containing protein n=1 Tax=Hypsizygus marmoreus TaxID=39966 RepID=A0A369JIN4_HYPMA|nr:hypothetical protein Hypma_011448 [Hypsizygus marmoreus]
MFFCIPIIFGCQTSLKPNGEVQAPRVCPRCSNASVFAAKSTTWFELFWVPLVPFSKKQIWFCNICQWQAPNAPGQFEPNVAGFAPPAYIHQTPQK